MPTLPGMSTKTKLTLDLLDLAHASISELGLTGDRMLTWRGGGPGLGRELRRAYSNIHGRIFARSYLEANEDVNGLLPIEGNNFSFVPGALVRLRNGKRGDMPDWIGWTATELIVAEAKGTSIGGDWEKSFWHGCATPQCLRTAQEQVARVQIDLNRYILDVGFKGWSVASRWATEENGLDPWLAAVDPNLGGEPPSPEEFRISAAEMQRKALQRMIAAFGFSNWTPMVSHKDPARFTEIDFRSYREYWRRLVLSDEREVRGLSAAYIGERFVPIIDAEDVVALTQLFAEDEFLWLATILETPLARAEQGLFFSEYEGERSGGYLSRNGLAVADLRQVRTVYPI